MSDNELVVKGQIVLRALSLGYQSAWRDDGTFKLEGHAACNGIDEANSLLNDIEANQSKWSQQ